MMMMMMMIENNCCHISLCGILKIVKYFF